MYYLLLTANLQAQEKYFYDSNEIAPISQTFVDAQAQLFPKYEALEKDITKYEVGMKKMETMMLVSDTSEGSLYAQYLEQKKQFIGTKIQLYKSDKVNLSVLPSIQIPSVYDDIGSLSEQPINTKIIGNYVVSKANSVGYTIGYTFNNNEIGYSLFLGHNFTDKISTFIELYGFNDQLNIDAGLAYLIQDKLQFDAYFGTGLNNKMVFASVGLSYLYLK